MSAKGYKKIKFRKKEEATVGSKKKRRNFAARKEGSSTFIKLHICTYICLLYSVLSMLL